MCSRVCTRHETTANNGVSDPASEENEDDFEEYPSGELCVIFLENSNIDISADLNGLRQSRASSFTFRVYMIENRSSSS